MLRIKFTPMIIVLACQVVSAQQKAATHRVGDAFRGAISTVRSETASVRREGDSQVEGPRSLMLTIKYSEDGLTREAVSYAPDGSVRQRTVETYLPGGNRQSYSVTKRDGSFSARIVYQYNDRGHLISETHYNSDGSIKETILTQVDESSEGIVAVARLRADGTRVDNSVNSRDAASRQSRWTTTEADGRRVEKTFVVDPSGNHRDEQISYNPDGSLAGRRVSLVDAGVARLEATEYAPDGSVLKKSLQTREYDAHRNLIKHISYRWNGSVQEFEPVLVTYNTISYRN